MWSKEVGLGLTVGCVCVVERGWSNCGMCVSKEVGLTVGCVCGRKSNCGMCVWSKEVGLTVGCVCVVERGWSNCGMCVWDVCRKRLV